MPLNERVDTHKGVETVFGKIIPEKEAYTYCMRTQAGFSANVYQVMRILCPSWEQRTAATAQTSYMINRISCGGGEGELNSYLEAFYDTWNIPELVNRSAWIGAIYGDYGDEFEGMAGRVIQFTEDRVEKELDTCPWDIVGSEMCNMTTGMFTANFDIAAGGENDGESTNKVSLNMCEARGCGNEHCRVVAERLDTYGLEHQDWLEHRGQPVDPVHDTPPERRVKETQGMRNGQYTQTFGEENSFEWQYHMVAGGGFAWSVWWPLVTIRQMAEPEELERIFRIVFATAGKNSFIEPFAREGLRSWLEVPREIGDNDPRVMGAYIGAVLGCQLVPFEWEAFDKDGVIIKVLTSDFTDRFGGGPMPELIWGYESEWHNAVKTLVSTEWSVWFDGVDEEYLYINVGRKVDDRMV